MEPTEVEKSGGIYPLLGIATLVIFPVYISLVHRFPHVRTFFPSLVSALGLGLIVFSLVMFQKFKKVLDYEPTRLWGRPWSGKKARNLFMQSGVSGGLLLVVGVVLRKF